MPSTLSALPAAFWSKRPLIGMVHLGALPGSVRYDADALPLDAVLDRARADAAALTAGGADAIMVENFFDAPFVRSDAPAVTIAAMTRAVLAVRNAAGVDVPVGVNVLRNDAIAALAVAAATGARFIRVNVYVGAAITDQGIIQGAAREAVLYRKQLGADVAIFADVFVKHAAQLGDPRQTTLEDSARDAVYRGLADALIVSGSATGSATDPETAARVVHAVPGTPVLVGSGFDVATARRLLDAGVAGAIVGTSLKAAGDVAAPVEAARVRALRTAMG